MTLLDTALRHFRERVTCPHCNGNGALASRDDHRKIPRHYRKCEACNGTGMVQHVFEPLAPPSLPPILCDEHDA